MTESSLPAVNVGTRQAVPPQVEDRPPGERYFRHPGDAVRVAVWGGVAAVLLLIVGLASNTAEGVTTDVGRLADRVALAARQLLFALVQLAAIAVPAVVVLGLVWRQRWRRLGVLVLAAVVGGAVMALIDTLLDLPSGFPSAVADDTWVASTSFPSTVYVASVAAAASVGKPWLSRAWRRAVDVGLASLIIGLALAGTLGLVALIVALAVGSAIGAAVLLVLGAPNRRPTPAAVATSLRDAGLPVSGLALRRAEGGRSQLYVAEQPGGRTTFVKVYDEDSRDADLLYRGYRTLLLRSPDDDRPPVSAGPPGRAQRPAPAPRPSGRGRGPGGGGAGDPRRRLGRPGARARGRRAAGEHGSRRRSTTGCSTRCGARSRPSTRRTWPTGRCAPPTCSSPAARRC